MEDEIGPGGEGLVLLRKRLARYPPTFKALFYNLEERVAADPLAPLPSTLDQLGAMEPPEPVFASVARLVESGHSGERVVKAFWVALVKTLPAQAIDAALRSRVEPFEADVEPAIVSPIAAQMESTLRIVLGPR